MEQSNALDMCAPEEDAAFGEIIKWCYKNKSSIRLVGDDLIITKKPMKQPRTSHDKQQSRAAIDRLVWGKGI